MNATSVHSCWTSIYPPEVCCAHQSLFNKQGLPACFNDEEYTYDRCCRGTIYDTDYQLPRTYRPQGLAQAPKPLDIRVDIFTLAHHRDAPMLELLLESIATLWPLEELRTQVVILVDHSADGVALCRRLELSEWNWMKCVSEESRSKVAGHMLSNIPTYYMADLYVSESADFIAYMDGDGVIFAPEVVSLLFHSDMRPIIKGSWWNTGRFSPKTLGMPYAGTIADPWFPFVVHRKHIRLLRERVLRLMGPGTFEDALIKMAGKVSALAKQEGWYLPGRSESLGFYNVIGHYIYHYHRDSYLFTIQNGGHIGLPLEHTCPSLFVYAHFGTPGHIKKARVGGRGELNTAYRLAAAEYTLAGICAIRSLPECEHVSVNLTELLVSGAPLATWTAQATEASEHCARRSIPQLLAEYSTALEIKANQSQDVIHISHAEDGWVPERIKLIALGFYKKTAAYVNHAFSFKSLVEPLSHLVYQCTFFNECHWSLCTSLECSQPVAWLGCNGDDKAWCCSQGDRNVSFSLSLQTSGGAALSDALAIQHLMLS